MPILVVPSPEAPPRDAETGPSAPPANDATQIDWSALEIRFNGRMNFIAKLFRTARDGHVESAENLRAAIARGDTQAVAFIAHRLKNVAGTLEAPELQAAAKRVEDHIRGGQMADLPQREAHDLADRQERLLRELDQHLERAEPGEPS
jgi:HPt (histidine-containing phosphotransfer) domain-containing protein